MKKIAVFLLCMLLLTGCSQQPAPQAPATPPAQPQEPAAPPPAAPQEPAAPQTPAEPEVPAQPEPPALPTVSGDRDPFNRTWGEMQSADFWIALCDDPQAERMTPQQIREYNSSLALMSGVNVENLDTWPETLSRSELLLELNYYDPAPSSDYYTGIDPITADQRAQLRDNRNEAAVADSNPVRYGFVTENLILRTYPSDLPLYDYSGDTEYDKAAETALKIWEPVLVLHTSADSQWLLVRAYDYLGWVKTHQVALCDRDQWDEVRADIRDACLTVLAPRLAMDGAFYNPGQDSVILKMGTILPLEKQSNGADNACDENCWIVRLPGRDENGNLQLISARIPKNEDVIRGSLPYTTENVLRQVFKLLGHRYGWGGLVEGWDCSSICQDVYRTMGLMIPRNSGNQRQIPGAVQVQNKAVADKQALLQEMLPGAMPELPGHQTMYIGTYEGESYVIHSTHGVYDKQGKFFNANSVIVSSVQAYRSNGRTLLENFRAYSVPQ